MGWTDSLKSHAGQTIDPGNLLGLGGTPGPAGVGGPETDNPENLELQADGTWLDKTTGTRFLDREGAKVIAAPNTNQLIAGSSANSQGMLDRNAVQDQRAGQAYAGQQAFSGDLNQVIRNPNAPTVSTSVMNQALGNIDRQQLAATAGMGGPNAASAQRHALDTMGQLDLQAAGQGAVARATEAAGARQAQAANLQNMAGNANEAINTNTGAASAFNNAALTGANANQAAILANNDKNKNQAMGAIGGITGAFSKLL